MRSRALLIGILAVAAACRPAGDDEPVLQANSRWTEPDIERRDGASYVDNAAPRAFLEVTPADGPVSKTRLLFWDDQAVARDHSGEYFVANSEDHEVLIFGADLEFRGALLPQAADGDRLQRPLTLAIGPQDRFAAFEASGSVIIFDRWGREFQRIEQPPFAYSVGVWGPRARLILARSPYNLAFGAEAADAPLLASLDPDHPEAPGGVGRARQALSPFYTHAANAGTVTTDAEGNTYYAALGRADVAKYDANGDLVWASERPVDFETPEPRLVPSRDGPARLAIATVQKALAIGPDRLLYVRSAADAEASHDRLDVLDPKSGDWLASAAVDTGTAILVGERGAAFQVPLAALLEERTRERREFASFALETFDGGQLGLEDLEGKVKLVSFWASWCGPCREELPLLDSLGRAFGRDDFAVIGINEDVDEEDAREFAAELGLTFPNLLGRGKMRQRYHYSGLPYSVLLDEEGRVVKDYYGFGGREAFDREVAARVMAELGADGTVLAAEGQDGHDRAGQRGAADHHHAADAVVETTVEDGEPSHEHGAQAGAAIPHGHGPTREVHGDEIEKLADYYIEVERLEPSSGTDIPAEHWEKVQNGLALVDRDVNVFMERFPGTLSLIRLMAIKTQLHVDVERLPESANPGPEFDEAWSNHVKSIHYLIEIYEELSGQLEE